MNIRVLSLLLALLVGFSFAADPRMEQGARFEAQGEFDKALGEYRAILAEQPQNSQAYYAAAEVYIKKSTPDYSRALANYRLAYKFTPTMSEAYEGAAKVYERLGEKSKAAAERAKDPKNQPVEEPVAETSTEQASSAVQNAPVVEPPPQTKDVQVAETTAQAEIKKDSILQEKPAVVENVQSSASIETSIENSSKDTEKIVEPTDPFEKGKSLLAEKNYKEAAKQWREVLAKQPGHSGAYFYAGVTRFEMGEYDKAEFNLKKGLDYKDEGNDANYYLACVYQKTNRLELEKKFLAVYLKSAAPDAKFRQVAETRMTELTVTPQDSNIKVAETTSLDSVVENVSSSSSENKVQENADLSISKANALFKSKNYEQALQMYKNLLEKDLSLDERYFAILQVGNVYRELRDFHSAVTRYREVVQQYPDSDWATQAERALEDAVWLEKHSKELPPRNR